jgi:bacterial/archaeal transporter family protein
MNWVIYALLSAFFASLIPILAKLGLDSLDKTLATTVRSFVMFGILFFFSMYSGVLKDFKNIDTNGFVLIFLSGLAGALSWLFYFYALKEGNASAVAALDRLSVIFVIILSTIFLQQELTLKVVLGGVLLTIGAILVAF